MFKISIFLALLVALIGLSAAQYRVKRQSFTASVAPNGYQATLNPYNQYNPYDPYTGAYNPYRPYQNPLYPGFPGQSIFPNQRSQGLGVVPQ